MAYDNAVNITYEIPYSGTTNNDQYPLIGPAGSTGRVVQICAGVTTIHAGTAMTVVVGTNSSAALYAASPTFTTTQAVNTAVTGAGNDTALPADTVAFITVAGPGTSGVGKVYVTIAWG